MSLSTLTLRRPDDFHVHLRDTAQMRAVVGATAQVFGRAIVMPNLKPPITTTDAAAGYRKRIRDALPADSRFEPLMTLYLTDNTSADDLARAIGAVVDKHLDPVCVLAAAQAARARTTIPSSPATCDPGAGAGGGRAELGAGS